MKIRSVIAAFTASAALASSASALVTYDSDATSTFTLDTTGGMIITYEIFPDMSSTATTGTGLASIDVDTPTPPPPGVYSFSPGEFVTQTSNVSGSADAPGGSSAASVLNGILITLVNPDTTAPAVASFTFEYTWAASYTKTDMELEAVDASPFFHLSGFAPSGMETLKIDGMDEPDWLFHPAIGSPFGGPVALGVAGTTTVDVEVTVPAGSTEAFSVITDSFGSAIRLSTVPEPVSATLGLMGLAALGYTTKRRRVA